jgi:hypothetical protein
MPLKALIGLFIFTALVGFFGCIASSLPRPQSHLVLNNCFAFAASHSAGGAAFYELLRDRRN